ncbi:MAG: glycoside hydrolase family 76 protein [Rhizobacter sp.]|nr:glycoside hydrolase family 76 protein [Rhizobacter sp.]
MNTPLAMLAALAAAALIAGCGGATNDANPAASPAAPDTGREVAAAIDPVAEARETAAMTKLLAGFNVRANGWTKGPTLDAIINIYQRTRDPKYRTLIDDSLRYGRGWRSGDSNKLYYDDMGWYANAWLRAYDVTGDRAFLVEAQAIFSDMTLAWDSTCGGGLWWTDERNYKNAITNELFLLAASRLARRAPNGTGPGSYRDWALKEVDWFINRSGMINAQGLINDGLNSSCQNNGQATWSYNQGVILGGLAEMFRLTGDRGYLASAELIAESAMSRMVHPNGTYRDVCDAWGGGCTGDALIFKGMFAQGLARLYNADRGNKPQYLAFLKTSADGLWANSRDAQNGLGVNWGGPVGTPTQSSQASGLLLLGGISLLNAFPRGEEQWEVIVPPKPQVSNLRLSDAANAAAWSVQQNLQASNLAYGDRSYTFSSVPALVAGGSWIRSANASKGYTGSPLVSFTVTAAPADVYIALDNRRARPSWVDSSWTDTGADLTQAESASVSRGFSLYRKRFNAGATVSLGAWNNTGTSMYTVIVQ